MRCRPVRLWLFAVVAFGATRGVRVALIGCPMLPLARAIAEVINPPPLGEVGEGDASAMVLFSRAFPNGTTDRKSVV